MTSPVKLGLLLYGFGWVIRVFSLPADFLPDVLLKNWLTAKNSSLQLLGVFCLRLKKTIYQ
jgi:hypothetical protein